MIETSPELTLSNYAEKIRNGEVLAFPTETVYGLGADARNADAVGRIFKLKGRPPDNPLIVHVSSLEMVELLAAEISEDATRLMERFWPGPLSIIFPKRPEVLDIVTAGLPTVAIRMPDHPIPLRLISEAGPIAAPSANTSGRPSPTRAEHVRQDFGDDMPIIEGGACQYGLESTVLDISRKPYTILRPGHITQTELEQVLRQPVRNVPPEAGILSLQEASDSVPRSPGMKYSHYAPDARVRWMSPKELPFPQQPDPGVMYLLHRLRAEQPAGDTAVQPENGGSERSEAENGNPVNGNSEFGGITDSKTLSSEQYPEHIKHYRENYTEMARDLYDRFRMADLKGYREVAIEPFETYSEFTEALLNRIRKAIGD